MTLEQLADKLTMEAKLVRDNFGYSSDSIKARDMFLACIDTRAKLSRMFDLDELYNLFQDY